MGGKLAMTAKHRRTDELIKRAVAGPVSQRQIESIALTDADREEAINVLYHDQPALVAQVQGAKRLIDAIDILQNELAMSEPSYKADPPGETALTAILTGIKVEKNGRNGIVTWGEIAQEWRDDTSFEQVESDDTVAGDSGDPPSRPPSPATSAPLPAAAVIESRDVELGAIFPNPFQPRVNFDAGELASLQASLEADGQAHPIILRPIKTSPGTYQVADGERRVRAAKRSKSIKTLRAEIRDYTDEQMAVIALVTEHERVELTDVEKARKYQVLIDQFGWTQKRVGEKFGISQGEVSNTIRQLQLPEAWQKRIISREISGTHGRSLVPFAKCPAILKAMEKNTKLSVADWEEMLRDVCEEQTRPLKELYYWDGDRRRTVDLKPTPEQREKLALLTVKDYNGDPEERASNIAYWEELQSAAEKKRELADAKRQAKAGAIGKSTSGSRSTSPKKPAVDMAKVFARRLYEWRINWLRYLCSERLGQPLTGLKTPGQAAPMRVLLYFAFDMASDGLFYSAGSRQFGQRDDMLRTALLHRDVIKLKTRHVWEMLAEAPPADFPKIWIDTLRIMLFSAKDGPQPFLPSAKVEDLADLLELDLVKCWKDKRGGPLTYDYLDLHTKDQLYALAKEWKFIVPPTGSKTEIVKALAEDYLTQQSIPKEILSAKAVK